MLYKEVFTISVLHKFGSSLTFSFCNMCDYKGLTDFLIQHSAAKHVDQAVTHTRIGDKDKTKKIYGGSYVIPQEKLKTTEKT